MVQLTEGKPIRDRGFATRVAIGKNVRCVEQLVSGQLANGAPVLVGTQHYLPKCRLMETTLYLGRCITSND